MTTFAHEVVPEIDLTNELGKKCVAALLPREGSGNFIKEVVSGEMLEFSGGITWNGDSVSAQTDGSYNNSTPLTENPLQDVDLATENFMVAVDVDVAALGTGNKNQDFFSVITAVSGSAVTLGQVSWDNYLGFNNNRKWVSAYKESSAGLKNTVTIFVWDAQELSVALYEGGKLVSKEFYPDSTSYTPTVTSLGIGNTLSKFRSSQVYHSVEPFTQQEINALVEDPYQIFQSVSDTQDQHELVFEAGNEVTIFDPLPQVASTTRQEYTWTIRIITAGLYMTILCGDELKAEIQYKPNQGHLRVAVGADNYYGLYLVADAATPTAATGDVVTLRLVIDNKLHQLYFTPDGGEEYLALQRTINNPTEAYTRILANQNFALREFGFKDLDDNTKDRFWYFDQWQQNTTVYDELARSPLSLTVFPETGGFVKEVGISEGVLCNGVDQYTSIPDWGVGNTTFDVYLEFTTNTLVDGKWMMLLGDRDAHNINERPVQIYVYSEGAVEVAFADLVAGRQGLIITALDKVKSNARNTIRYSYDGTTATLDINDGEWVYTIEAIGFSCISGCKNIGRENADILFHSATLIGDNGDNRLYDFTATLPNKEVPDIAYHADGIPQNGTLVGFNNLHLTDKITTLTGQKFDGESTVNIPLWTAVGDFRIEGSFLFSPNSAIALGYTLEGANVIGCIETGAIRARYKGDSGNTKLDISGFTIDEVVYFVFERVGDQTTFTANEVTTDPSTNTGTVYFDTIGAYSDPLQNFFDNVIGTLKLTEAGGDNREYDFKNRIIGSELIDKGVGAKHGVITGQLEHINADSYNEVIGYRFDGVDSYATIPTWSPVGAFTVEADIYRLDSTIDSDWQVIIGSTQIGKAALGYKHEDGAHITIQALIDGEASGLPSTIGKWSNIKYVFTLVGDRYYIEYIQDGISSGVLSLHSSYWLKSANIAVFDQIGRWLSVHYLGASLRKISLHDIDGTDNRVYDFSIENSSKILDVLGNQHATIINTPTSGFLPVIDRNVFTIGDGKDYTTLDSFKTSALASEGVFVEGHIYNDVVGEPISANSPYKLKGVNSSKITTPISFSAIHTSYVEDLIFLGHVTLSAWSLSDLRFSRVHALGCSFLMSGGYAGSEVHFRESSSINSEGNGFKGADNIDVYTTDCIVRGANYGGASVWTRSYERVHSVNCIAADLNVTHAYNVDFSECTGYNNFSESSNAPNIAPQTDMTGWFDENNKLTEIAQDALRGKGWNGTNICDWAYVEVYQEPVTVSSMMYGGNDILDIKYCENGEMVDVVLQVDGVVVWQN